MWRDNHKVAYNYWGSSNVGAEHSLVRPGDTARSRSQELQFGRFSLDIRKSFLIHSCTGKGQKASVVGDFKDSGRERPRWLKLPLVTAVLRRGGCATSAREPFPPAPPGLWGLSSERLLPLHHVQEKFPANTGFEVYREDWQQTWCYLVPIARQDQQCVPTRGEKIPFLLYTRKQCSSLEDLSAAQSEREALPAPENGKLHFFFFSFVLYCIKPDGVTEGIVAFLRLLANEIWEIALTNIGVGDHAGRAVNSS